MISQFSEDTYGDVHEMVRKNIKRKEKGCVGNRGKARGNETKK